MEYVVYSAGRYRSRFCICETPQHLANANLNQYLVCMTIDCRACAIAKQFAFTNYVN